MTKPTFGKKLSLINCVCVGCVCALLRRVYSRTMMVIVERANRRIIPWECGHPIDSVARSIMYKTASQDLAAGSCTTVAAPQPLPGHVFSHNRHFTDCFFLSLSSSPVGQIIVCVYYVLYINSLYR